MLALISNSLEEKYHYSLIFKTKTKKEFPEVFEYLFQKFWIQPNSL